MGKKREHSLDGAKARKKHRNEMALKRENREYRDREKSKKNESRRSISDYRAQEYLQKNEARRNRRSDLEYRSQELSHDNETRLTRRSDPEYLLEEQIRDNSTRQIRNESESVWEKCVQKYEEMISDGPYHRCCSCDRLFFLTQVKTVSREKLIEFGCKNEFIDQVILDDVLNDAEFTICTSCLTPIQAKRFPRFNIKTSDLAFPVVPSIIKNLTDLEERLISPRIPFMKIYALGCDRQFGIKGGIINVPVDIPQMFSSIPILPSQSHIIQLKLKRRMCQQNYYLFEKIRPDTVYEAARLMCLQDLFIKFDIKLDESWRDHNIEEFNVDAESDNETETLQIFNTMPFVNEKIGSADEGISSLTQHPEEQISSADNNEQESEELDLQEETLIDMRDGVEFAPGEGQTPLSVLTDTYCEELAFPRIWFGQARKHARHVKLSYQDHLVSELMRSDRSHVRPDYLLFVNRKSDIMQLSSKINVALRKTTGTENITAANALDKNIMNNHVANDSAFRFSAGITGTPAYWEKQKKNVMAMVRQLGIFTFFVTLTAAEAQWTELLKILKKTVDKEDCSNVLDLPWLEKSRLIRTDPVTCARYFHHRFQEVFKTWQNPNGPFNGYTIAYKYHRVEFQHRGSPHVHMLLWIKNAPVYNLFDSDSEEQVIRFIDSIITTKRDDPELEHLVQYQFHKCTHTCKRVVRGKTICRFHAPFTPMDKTRILKPLDESHDMEQEQMEYIKKLNQKLDILLKEQSSSILNFGHLLEKLDCTLEDYILAARVKLNNTKIFLNREPKDCRINGYNIKILSLMRSNMDIQFVLDPYACVKYISDYINKPTRGLSKLMRACVEDFKNGNYSLREKLKKVSNVLYNSSEISAQEAAWCRLRLPMSVTSVAVEFINTGPIKARHKMLKSDDELRALDPGSLDITKSGPIEHYAQRPDELEEYCLADFIARYTFSGKKSNNAEDDGCVVESLNSNARGSKKLKSFILKDQSGKVTERREPKVIRTRKYNVHQDPVNFYRELVMLYKPWRNEVQEIESQNCENIYNQNKESIKKAFRKYNRIEVDLDELLEDVERQNISEESDANEGEETQNDEGIEEFVNVFDYDDTVIQPNLMIDIGQEAAGIDKMQRFTLPDQLDDKSYFELCDSLNMKQKDYLMHIISRFKDTELPLYDFISGGAGTGKSVLIKAIYQSVIRILRNKPGTVHALEALLLAFTGKAAHNIGGMTAHSAFSLLAGMGHDKDMKDLGSDRFNTLYTKLQHLKLIIIDEISMLSSELFLQISRRLCQLFKTKLPFGGISVICVGDFNQLRPVGGKYVFMAKGKDPVANLVGNPLWELFNIYELTEIMRQKEDLQFAEALSRLATSSLTQADIEMFKKRCFNENNLPLEAQNAVRLFATNDEVDAYNLQCVKRRIDPVNPKHISYRAVDKFVGNVRANKKAQAIEAIRRKKTRELQNLPTNLTLMPGIRYMVSTNIDISDGLFNGASGILRHMEVVSGQCHSVYIEFDDVSVGVKARANRKSIIEANKFPTTWTPIQRCKKTFNVLRNGTVQVCREQYPLVIAEGITIHKSQGQSMEKVVVQLETSKMRCSLMYVALSRATSLNGLYLLGNFIEPNPPNSGPIKEMTRMRTQKCLTPKFRILHEIPKDEQNLIQIISCNVQSFRAHQSSLASDFVLQVSDLWMLQETWLKEDEQIKLPDMIEVCRNKSIGGSSGKGTILFINEKYKHIVSDTFTIERSEAKERIEITSCIVGDIRFINLYRNPNPSHQFFLKILEEHKKLFEHPNIVLAGDFNEDLETNNRVTEFLKSNFGLQLVSPVESTTNGNTVIDAVFTRLEDFQIASAIYESYFSYHKPIVFRIK